MQAMTETLVTVRSTVVTTAAGLDRLRSLLTAAKQVETRLYEQREHSYRRGDSVFAITVPSDTPTWTKDDVRLPKPTVNMILEGNAYHWLTTYCTVLYNETAWYQATTRRLEKYRYTAQQLVIPQQRLSYPAEQVVTISIDDVSIPLQLTEATVDDFRAAETVKLSLVSPEHPAVRAGAIATESPALWLETTPSMDRVAAATPGPDGRVSRRHVKQLDQCRWRPFAASSFQQSGGQCRVAPRSASRCHSGP
jgi:hypothetical protein